MSRCIIICGLPGVGKTTLANALSRKLGIFCLHKDSVKESLYASMHMETLEDSKRLGYPSVKTILDLAEENIARGVDVIVESTFTYPEEGHVFETWKRSYDVHMLCVILKVDEQERERRFTSRERDRCHHDSERVRTFHTINSDYDHMPEKKTVLSSRHPVEILVKDILSITF